jgi:phosphatidylinositol alpha-1,6-mannosyltransferase
MTPDFPPVVGGISSYLFHIYQRFDLSRVTLIAPQHPAADEFDRTQSYSASRFAQWSAVPGLRGSIQLWQMYRRVQKLMARSEGGLILHCGHINAAMAARQLKRRYQVPYLVWTYALEIMDKWLRSRIIPALEEADLVISISDFTREFIASQGVPRERIAKIAPGADPELFRPGQDAIELKRRLGVEGRPVLLTVARIVKANRYKGHDVVLAALARVVQAVPNIAYVIVGSGDDFGYLDSLARKFGVRESVIFAGFVPDAELPLYYNACDVFVMCSREERGRRGVLAEGFGIAFLEASACGKPVIGGHSGGVPEAIRDGITGFLVNPNDAGELAGKILRVLQEPVLAETLGRNGRQWIESEMNWGRGARELGEALDRFFPAVG